MAHLTQSTYCETIKNHCDAINRSVHVVNLGAHGPLQHSSSLLRVARRRRRWAPKQTLYAQSISP